MTVGELINKLEELDTYPKVFCFSQDIIYVTGKPELFEGEVLIYATLPLDSMSSKELLESLKKEDKELLVKIVVREPKEIKEVIVSDYGIILS